MTKGGKSSLGLKIYVRSANETLSDDRNRCWMAALQTYDAYRTENTSDVFTCQKKCNTEVKCKYFVYDKTTGKCWLKSDQGATSTMHYTRSQRVSGPGECPPPPVATPQKTSTSVASLTDTGSSGSPSGGDDKGQKCAQEHSPDGGNVCKCHGTVSYGTRGAFFSKRVAGSITCNNANFGDPIYGVVKDCFCQDEKGVRCAAEHGTCECNGVVLDYRLLTTCCLLAATC